MLPAFAEGAGASGLQVEKPSGGNPFYPLGGSDGDVAAFGVTDGLFVVASDTERAGEIALEDPESVDGTDGALALRRRAGAGQRCHRAARPGWGSVAWRALAPSCSRARSRT